MRPLPAGLFVLAAVLASSPAAARPSALRGVVEGYYGQPWTGTARRDVIRFLGRHGLDTFVYAPKNDEFHRARWREPYPPPALADLARTARTARRSGVAFVYALSPVLDVCYSCRDDFAALTAKFARLARVRVRRFALLFDDGGALTAPEDQERYGGNDRAALGRAQADLVNRTRRWLRRRGLPGLRLIVPSEYAGTTCLPYHAALAGGLERPVPIGWTGSNVFAATITAAEAAARAACLPGHPVVLWDNYPVNDTVLSNNLHLGPLTGREPALPGALGGYLLNPMTQPHASLVALGTAAAYLRDPEDYDAEQAWADVLAELGGGGTGLGVLAAQVRSSPIALDDALGLAAALDAVAAAYAGPDWAAAMDALDSEEARQAGAPADIDARLGGTPLATEIAPWVAELATHTMSGTDAARLLRALKPDLVDVTTTPGGGTLRVTGRALGPDEATAATLGPGFAAEAGTVAARIATPPSGDFLRCLGNFLGAEIHFCPEFGLNVHGKALAFLVGLPASLTVISDRNVHDRLVLFTAAAYESWTAGRGPGAGVLTLTADGTPLPLAPDGGFDATLPAPTGSVTLLVTTAAGEATARRVP